MTLSPARWLSEERRKHMLGHAAATLEHDEEVQHWVRARNFEDKREGYLILTDRRFIVRWVDPEQGSAARRWDEISAWGLCDETPTAPVLAVATPGGAHLATLPVTSANAERRIRGFLDCLARLAPAGRPPPAPRGYPGEFRATGDARIACPPRSAAGRWRRAGVTVIGILLLLGGILLSLPLVPGPGIVLLVAGFGVLASEYDWAKDALGWVRERFRKLIKRRSPP